MTSGQIDLFERVKRETNGYLKPEVYRRIHDAARNAPGGGVIDIGPAQGGSTISLGLGRLAGGHDLEIYSMDMFRGSNALRSKTDVSLNIGVLKENLARYGLANDVRVIGVGEEDPATIIPADLEIAVLFIDADGALDRDFMAFYRQLVPGASVILDDYQDVVNKHARGKYLHFTPEDERKYCRNKNVATLRDAAPLGKEYSTFRFANALIDGGFLVPEQTIGNTLFTRKPDSAGLNEAFDIMNVEFPRVRDQVYEDYVKARSEL